MLYQECRPQTLQQIFGNQQLLRSISECFSVPTHSHVHVLAGDTGTGKTTLARVVSTQLLHAAPVCINEINTADNRGIDTVRDIIAQTKYKPIVGNALVFIIDEAHGLSTDAKRALLKPLEEVPSYVYYFLCTTDAAALFKGDEGKAIKSRVSLWQLSRLTNPEMMQLVSAVAASRNILLPQDVLQSVVTQSEGIPRQALVLLEQAQSGSCAAFQVSEQATSIEFCRALYGAWSKKAEGWRQVSSVLVSLKDQGADAEAVRRCVLGYAQSILLKSGSAAALDILDIFSSSNTYDSGLPKIVLMSFKVCYCS